MIIRIMRHGDAPTIDGVRQLSHQGIEESRIMGAWLAEQPPIDKLLVSPLLRAQQTSSQVERSFHHTYGKSDEPLLKPEASAHVAREYFQMLCPSAGSDSEIKSILLISHMPLVVNLLESWVPGEGCYFPTASIAELEIIDQKVKLKRFIKPSDLV